MATLSSTSDNCLATLFTVSVSAILLSISFSHAAEGSSFSASPASRPARPFALTVLKRPGRRVGPLFFARAACRRLSSLEEAWKERFKADTLACQTSNCAARTSAGSTAPGSRPSSGTAKARSALRDWLHSEMASQTCDAYSARTSKLKAPELAGSRKRSASFTSKSATTATANSMVAAMRRRWSAPAYRASPISRCEAKIASKLESHSLVAAGAAMRCANSARSTAARRAHSVRTWSVVGPATASF
mmetsp:Transcript_16006/g.33873  ORF Transcript_16006/g.33873 Transcript_16006/m.33873 type:complete len:247 (-) Transcript_16006:2043-2783(-)